MEKVLLLDNSGRMFPTSMEGDEANARAVFNKNTGHCHTNWVEIIRPEAVTEGAVWPKKAGVWSFL